MQKGYMAMEFRLQTMLYQKIQIQKKASNTECKLILFTWNYTNNQKFHAVFSRR